MYYIYKITNKINGKIYVGRHKTCKNEPFDRYWGSGPLIKQAIKKYGKENFKKEILEECTKDTVATREIYWIDKLGAREGNYNITAGGPGGDSTNGTIVYNNGKNIKYIKQGEPIPDGYVKGTLSAYHTYEWRIGCSKSSKGKHHNFTPWNKGKRIDNPSVKLNAYSARQTIFSQGILKGANNPRAKTFILIDPDGTKYEVTGTLRQFCDEHHLSMNMMKKYRNKGPIPKSKNNTSRAITAINTVGWEIIEEDKNFVEQARINRAKRYNQLLKEGKLTRRQNNINKILLCEKVEKGELN